MAYSPPHCVVAIGASAGGLDALRTIAGSLPAGLPAAVLVVMHLSPDRRSMLSQILTRSGPLPAVVPRDGERLEPGVIYVAPPDRHLFVEEGAARVVAGPRENLHRPAVDPLFRSAARWYGHNAIGVVLSGSLDDGTIGLASIRAAGGRSIAQDPATATFDSMPANAIEAGVVDEILPPELIGQRLAALVAERVAAEEPAAAGVVARSGGDTGASGQPSPSPGPGDTAAGAPAAAQQSGQGHAHGSRTEGGSEDGKVANGELRDYEWDPAAASAVPSVFVCPDCGGTLFELEENGVLHFRCRVGHAYSPASLVAADDERLEQALTVALRALEERAELSHRLQARANLDGRIAAAQTHEERLVQAEREAATIRHVLGRYRETVAGDEGQSGG